MYPKGIFGKFYPVNSLMHKINTSIKIVGFLIIILLLFFSMSLELHLMIFTLLVLMILLTKVPIKYFFRIFYSLRYLYLILIFIFAAISFDLPNSIVSILKIIIIVEYLALISYTSLTSELSYGISRIIEPFNFLNLKLGKLSYLITSLIKFYPTFINNSYIVLKSQASRGIDYGFSDIFGRTYALLNAFRYSFSKTLLEMRKNKKECDIRLYNLKRKRTNINKKPIGVYDIALLFSHFLLAFVYIVDSGIIF